jgi:hypothetical protein
MDILSITLWVIGIIIGHLLLRRVVEIDNMNKELVQERQKNINVGAIKEQSDDDLEKELMDYVNSQDYLLPTIVENNPVTNMVMTNPDAKPLENTNIIQEFMEEKDINSGNFGNLKAYDGNLFAELL